MEAIPSILFLRETGFFTKNNWKANRFEITTTKNTILKHGYSRLYPTRSHDTVTRTPYTVLDMDYSFTETGEKYLAVGSSNGRVSILNKQTNIISDSREHNGMVTRVRWSPIMPNQLATASIDSHVKVLKLQQDGEICVLKNCKGHTGAVNVVAFNHQSQVLASGGNDGAINLWDTRGTISTPISKIPYAQGTAVAVPNDPLVREIYTYFLTTYDQHGIGTTGNPVADLTFKDDNILVSCGSQIKLWDVRNCTESVQQINIPDFVYANSAWYSGVNISQDHFMYVAASGNSIYRYQIGSSNLIDPVPNMTYKTPLCRSYFEKMDISRDGRFLISGSESNEVYIFDTLDQSPDPFHTIKKENRDEFNIVRFHPETCFRIAMNNDMVGVCIWECSSINSLSL